MYIFYKKRDNRTLSYDSNQNCILFISPTFGDCTGWSSTQFNSESSTRHNFLIITFRGRENADQIPDDTKFGRISDYLKYRYEIKNVLVKINQLKVTELYLRETRTKFKKSRRQPT